MIFHTGTIIQKIYIKDVNITVSQGLYMSMWCYVETLKHIERDQQGRTIHRLEDILAPSSITTPLEDIEQ